MKEYIVIYAPITGRFSVSDDPKLIKNYFEYFEIPEKIISMIANQITCVEAKDKLAALQKGKEVFAAALENAFKKKEVEVKEERLKKFFNLTWNVYIFDMNTNELKEYNIFKHGNFLKSVLKDAEEEYGEDLPDYEKFKERVRKELRYYFWSKCEWELIMSPWPPHEDDKDKKIDVYEQIMLNFDQFYRYLYYGLFGDCEQCEEN